MKPEKIQVPSGTETLQQRIDRDEKARSADYDDGVRLDERRAMIEHVDRMRDDVRVLAKATDLLGKKLDEDVDAAVASNSQGLHEAEEAIKELRAAVERLSQRTDAHYKAFVVGRSPVEPVLPEADANRLAKLETAVAKLCDDLDPRYATRGEFHSLRDAVRKVAKELGMPER